MSKPLQSLSPLRLLAERVWELDLTRDDDAFVFPVKPLPVSSLECRLVATHVVLANGDSLVGLLGNLSLEQPEMNEHFLTLKVFGAGATAFDLARYHDADHHTRGPEALARFLSLPLSAVFPIQYDLGAVVSGASAAVRGLIAATPAKPLSRSQLIALAVQ